MFERNFTKSVNIETFKQEALAEKSGLGSKGKQNKKKTNGISHYCKEEGHWIRNCNRWIADERPGKNTMQKTDDKKTVSTNVALLRVCD